MLYSALCLDNTKYFENGTIRVRVFEYYSVPRRKYDKTKKTVVDTNVDDLSVRAEELNIGEKGSLDEDTGTDADFEALVYAPLGGGRNYGMFALPKTNEKGVVAFLDGMFSKPIWMGSYFQPIRKSDDYNTVEYVNAPNDDPNQEGLGSDLANNGAINSTESDALKGDQDTIILRTKRTYPNPQQGDSMNFEKVSTENLVALDDKKVRVRHYTKWENEEPKKYQEVLMYDDEDNSDKETIKLEVNNTSDNKQSYVKVTEDGFDFYMNNNGEETRFKLGVSAESDSIYFEDKDGNTIVGKSGYLAINGEDESVVLYSDLKSILEDLAEHIHIGSVPTKGPLTPKKAPLKYNQEMTNMEGSLIKSNNSR
jgi:hypothetical protein